MRCKMYAFECGNESKNKIKAISKSYSKNIEFEEYNKCLDGRDYEKICDNCISGSLNHEMYLQETKKSSLSIFDEKRCYIHEFESIAWI